MTEVTGVIMIIAVWVMFELSAMRERYVIDKTVDGIDAKLEEITLMLTRSEEQDAPRLVRATDVVDVLSAELNIPISELIVKMAAVPSVEVGE